MKVCQQVDKVHTQYYGSAFVLGISCFVSNMCVIKNELQTMSASYAKREGYVKKANTYP